MLRKSLLCAVLLLLGTLRLPAQTTPSPAQAPAKAPIVIPFAKTTGPTSLIPLDVMIHGKGPYSFFLDTGSPITIITPDLAAELGIKPFVTDKIAVKQNKPVTVGVAKLNSVEFGGVSLAVENCVLLPMPTHTPFRGVIGLQVFGSYVIKIDYASHILTLFDPDTFTYQGKGVAFPLSVKENDYHKVMVANVDGIPARLVMDTGWDSELDLSAAFVKANNLKKKYQSKMGKTSVETFTGGEKVKTVNISTLTLGKSVFRDVPTSMQEPGSLTKTSADGILGGEIMRRFTVTFDYNKGSVWFEPNTNFAAPYFADRCGFDAQYEAPAYVIQSVNAHSPGAKANLKAGDLIMKINGKDATQVDLLQYNGLITASAGTALHLTVQSGKTTREVTLVLADYD